MPTEQKLPSMNMPNHRNQMFSSIAPHYFSTQALACPVHSTNRILFGRLLPYSTLTWKVSHPLWQLKGLILLLTTSQMMTALLYRRHSWQCFICTGLPISPYLSTASPLAPGWPWCKPHCYWRFNEASFPREHNYNSTQWAPKLAHPLDNTRGSKLSFILSGGWFKSCLPTIHHSSIVLRVYRDPTTQFNPWPNKRMQHAAMSKVNALICAGIIKAPLSVARAPDPICAICQYAKAKCRPHRTTHRSIIKQHLRPGDGVSADQMEASSPSLLPTTKGAPTKRPN